MCIINTTKKDLPLQQGAGLPMQEIQSLFQHNEYSHAKFSVTKV